MLARSSDTLLDNSIIEKIVNGLLSSQKKEFIIYIVVHSEKKILTQLFTQKSETERILFIDRLKSSFSSKSLEQGFNFLCEQLISKILNLIIIDCETALNETSVVSNFKDHYEEFFDLAVMKYIAVELEGSQFSLVLRPIWLKNLLSQKITFAEFVRDYYYDGASEELAQVLEQPNSFRVKQLRINALSDIVDIIQNDIGARDILTQVNEKLIAFVTNLSQYSSVSAKIDPIPIESFHARFSGNQEITLQVFEILISEGFINTTFDNFNLIFSGKKIMGFKPIIWSVKSERGKLAGKGNKTALYVLLEVLLGEVTNQDKKRASIFFVDDKGNSMDKITRPAPEVQINIDFENLLIPLKEKTDHPKR